MSFSNIDLSRELVQAVRDAADIVGVASEHTKLERKGRDYQGVCPLHKEKTPSFHVDPDKGLFYCFGCGAGGDAIKLHMLTSGDDFPAAIESLALRYGIPVRERRKRRPDEPDPERALAAAAEFFVDQLGRHELPRRYLEGRRVPGELVERYGIGYAPDAWTALTDALSKRVPQRDLEAGGLIRRSSRGSFIDSFRNRLMFPIHNPSGRLVGFGGRALGDDTAKYVNTAETERFHKGELLYGLYQGRRAIRDGNRAVLVEGYFDVVGAAAAGVEGAVATMGTALTPEQARLLARYAEEVVVAYDGDDAGENAHRRALPILLGEGMAVYRARFPAGHDPDSLRLEAGNAALVKAVGGADDSVLAEIARLTPPEARRREPRPATRAAAAQDPRRGWPGGAARRLARAGRPGGAPRRGAIRGGGWTAVGARGGAQPRGAYARAAALRCRRTGAAAAAAGRGVQRCRVQEYLSRLLRSIRRKRGRPAAGRQSGAGRIGRRGGDDRPDGATPGGQRWGCAGAGPFRRSRQVDAPLAQRTVARARPGDGRGAAQRRPRPPRTPFAGKE